MITGSSSALVRRVPGVSPHGDFTRNIFSIKMLYKVFIHTVFEGDSCVDFMYVTMGMLLSGCQGDTAEGVINVC